MDSTRLDHVALRDETSVSECSMHNGYSARPRDQWKVIRCMHIGYRYVVQVAFPDCVEVAYSHWPGLTRIVFGKDMPRAAELVGERWVMMIDNMRADTKMEDLLDVH